jgi:hypothetical protein
MSSPRQTDRSSELQNKERLKKWVEGRRAVPNLVRLIPLTESANVNGLFVPYDLALSTYPGGSRSYDTITLTCGCITPALYYVLPRYTRKKKRSSTAM